MLLSLSIALVDLIFPYITRHTMNTLLPEKMFTTFFLVMGILFACYLLRAWFQYLVTIIGHRMGTLVEADMRRDVFQHMQSLSFSFFDRNRTGVLMAHVTNDLFEIVELAHHGPENLLICGVTLVGALIILLTINVKLTLVLLVLLPICVVFSIRQRLNMQQANKDVKVKTGEINAAIESGISGIRTSKAFAAEKAEDEKFDRANEAFKNSKVRYYRAMGLFNAGIEATVGIMQVAVVSFGGLLIMREELGFVDLLTFTLYVSAFTTPIRKLVQFMEVYAQGSAGFARFVELMRTKPDISDAPNAEELQDVKGDIRFDHVSFSYLEGIPVLEDIQLTFQVQGPYVLQDAEDEYFYYIYPWGSEGIPDIIVGAFINGVCMGYSVFSEENYGIIRVRSNNTSAQSVTFKIYNYLSEEEYVPTVSKAVSFQSDGIAGEPGNPIVLDYNPPLKGDANNDGKRESADIIEIVKAMTGQPSSAYKEKLADTNSDNIVNIADIIWIINTIMATQ